LNTINPELIILGEPTKTAENCVVDADCPLQFCVGGRCCQQSDLDCAVDADCPSNTCNLGKCCQKSNETCTVDADCPALICTAEGFCSPFATRGWGCSTYTNSGDCEADANCDWCPCASGTQINSYQKDICLNTGMTCMYGGGCVKDKCGWTCASDADCTAPQTCQGCVCQ